MARAEPYGEMSQRTVTRARKQPQPKFCREACAPAAADMGEPATPGTTKRG